MKLITKLGLFSAGLLLALLCLHGCFVAPISPPLTVSVSPDRGHPPFDVTIVTACSEEGGTYTLIVNDEVLAESGRGAFVTRVLDWPWVASITWSDETGGFSEAPVTVSLENKIPVAHQLYTSPDSYQYHALIMIDLRYLRVGCISGEPEFYSGIEDPDFTSGGYSIENDGFTYRIEIKDAATGKKESVFYGPDRTLMGSEYVECPIFYWFVEHSGAAPIIPYLVWSPMGCEPSLVSVPLPGQGVIEKQIHVYVMEWGTARHWVYTIFASSPGCSP